MEPDEEPDAPEGAPSPMPPDPFARGQASAVQLHEAYMWLRSGRFSMVEALVYLASSMAVNTMIGAQEAAVAAAQENPEPPEQD